MDIKPFVTYIKSQFQIKFLEIHLDLKFGATASGYREEIRKNIVKTYSPLLSTYEKKKIVNLDALPVAENLFFSISHNKSIGGYVACDRKTGFDIEEVSRLSAESINRVCKPAEVSACPDYRLLWSAKESALKIFKQEFLVTDIEILSWEKQGDFYYFEAVCHKAAGKIFGLTFLNDQFTVACSFLN